MISCLLKWLLRTKSEVFFLTNRVVVTGLGVVSPIGIGREAFWQALMDGKNGIDKITRFDAADYPSQIAGEVKDFNPADFIDTLSFSRIMLCSIQNALNLLVLMASIRVGQLWSIV